MPAPHHEIAADAGRYVDAADPGAIARAILDLIDSPAERERMSQAGLARARAFSWQATAAATRAALLDVLGPDVSG